MTEIATLSYSDATGEPPSLANRADDGESVAPIARRSRRTQLYARMERVRSFAQLVESLTGNRDTGSLPGAEPVAVGLCAALGPSDTLVATYAESAFAIASGGDPRSIALRVIDRVRGARGEGRRRLAHPTARCIEARDFAAHRIGLATSLGVSDRLRSRRRALVCAIDGTHADEAELHDAVQAALDWRLPIVFAVETNRLGEHDADRVARLAREMRIAYDEVWGFDPLALTEAVHHAIEASLEGSQPRLVEVLTAYVSERCADEAALPFGDVEDPISVFREAIECAGEALPSELIEMAAHVRAEMRRLTFELANEHDGIVSARRA
jgi:TPP-dependent pyruvate/acetoin dehydrogenase alpha subunit